MCSNSIIPRNQFNGEIENIEAIDASTVCEIQKDIEPRDVISLVFLLYDVALTALQRLIIFQRISKDNYKTNLLTDWVLDVQTKDTLWRNKFIEALAICQLYGVIRKLGLNVTKVKECYVPDKKRVSFHINSVKKILYKLCECMKETQFIQFKEALSTHSIDTTEYDACELVILKLITDNKIAINKDEDVNLKFLYQIIENISGLNSIAEDLSNYHVECAQISKSILLSQADNVTDKSKDNGHAYIGNLNVFEQFNELMEDDVSLDFDSDSKNKSFNLRYPIKNPNELGVCYIINQETFSTPSERFISQSDTCLANRTSSKQDKLALESIMRKLNFDIISHDNLDHKSMIKNIKNIIKYRVKHDHSIFMMCILSHGIKGHVYAADSVAIRVDDIQNLFDTDEALHLRGLPKVMIIQACQVNVDKPSSLFHADAPKLDNYYISKSDCLIFNATARDLEAFRHERHGSIFIYVLCIVLKKHAHNEDLLSLFTRVNNFVQNICKNIQKNQTSEVITSLTKKVYLTSPRTVN